MANSSTMTTRKPQRHHDSTIMKWRVRRTNQGEMIFVPLKDKKPKMPVGGTIQATLTKSVMGGRVNEAVAAVVEAGGSVAAVRGRLMTIEVSGDDVEAVGDALDSFGCQWDMETN